MFSSNFKFTSHKSQKDNKKDVRLVFAAASRSRHTSGCCKKIKYMVIIRNEEPHSRVNIVLILSRRWYRKGTTVDAGELKQLTLAKRLVLPDMPTITFYFTRWFLINTGLSFCYTVKDTRNTIRKVSHVSNIKIK